MLTALKMLPFAAALDPRRLQRFRNEAQAAAALHHTNIVPVFGVGCERGVHFYAMQYIDGRSLACIITELRRVAKPDTPEPERRAQALSAAAEALVRGASAAPEPAHDERVTTAYQPPDQRVAGAERSDAPDRGFRPVSPGRPAQASSTQTA